MVSYNITYYTYATILYKYALLHVGSLTLHVSEGGGLRVVDYGGCLVSGAFPV